MFSNKEKFLFTICYPIVAIAQVVIMVLCYDLFFNQLYLERQDYFKDVSTKTVENVDIMLNHYHDDIDLFEELMLSKNVDNIDELEKLVYSNPLNYDSKKVLFLVDDNRFVSSDGLNGKAHDFLLSTTVSESESKNTIISTIPYHNDTMYFIFIKNISSTVNENDFVGIALELNYIEELFMNDRFANECSIYITSNSGEKLYTCSTNLDLGVGDNVYNDFKEKSKSKANAYKNNDSYNSMPVEIEYSGYDEELFIVNIEFESVDANLVVCAPLKMLSKHSEGITTTSKIFFPIMGVFLVTLIILIILIYRKIIKNNAENIGRHESHNKELSEALAIAQRSNEAKSRFLSYMSHDIRTPLNGIIGMNQIARKSINNPTKLKACLDKIAKASDHLLSLLNDVLDLSKIEHGKTVMKYERMNLYGLLDNCYDIIKGQTRTRSKLKIIKDYCELSTSHIKSDELHLRQILINILGNAIKFTPDGGSVTLKMREYKVSDTQIGIIIQVKDTGIGMDEEFLKVLWEPFVQNEKNSSRTKYPGSGLGMTITKSFVELLGGTISVESEVNVGTTFTLNFVFDIDLDFKEEETISIHVLDLSNSKIMLVEDNEFNREIGREILTELGVEVIEACNGHEAVELFKSNEPNTFSAILMDIMMPVMNGHDATKTIRNLNREDAKTIPIIALTANAFDEDIKKNKEAGMDEHLSKPIDLDEFKRVLVKIFNKN